MEAVNKQQKRKQTNKQNKRCGRRVRLTWCASARPYVTLTFDRLTLKLVCESHLRWGTFVWAR